MARPLFPGVRLVDITNAFGAGIGSPVPIEPVP